MTGPCSSRRAVDVILSTMPRWFGQRFGKCAECGASVKIRKGTLSVPNAHNRKDA